ncbi:hypothetical protein J2X83_004874 [Brevibacillus nitrificans]|nr:hypothetical protein [Brevibacillus nitrificans]
MGKYVVSIGRELHLLLQQLLPHSFKRFWLSWRYLILYGELDGMFGISANHDKRHSGE